MQTARSGRLVGRDEYLINAFDLSSPSKTYIYITRIAASTVEFFKEVLIKVLFLLEQTMI